MSSGTVFLLLLDSDALGSNVVAAGDKESRAFCIPAALEYNVHIV